MKLHRLSKKSFVRRSLKNSWGRLVASLGIRHLHIFHNAPYLPPKILHKHCFHFSWDGCNTQEKWKTKVTQNCGRQIRCIMGNVQLANGTVLGVKFCHAVSRAAFDWPMDELGSYCIPNNVPFSSSAHHRPSCSPGLQNGHWFDGEWVNTSQWPMHGKAKSLSFLFSLKNL